MTALSHPDTSIMESEIPIEIAHLFRGNNRDSLQSFAVGTAANSAASELSTQSVLLA